MSFNQEYAARMRTYMWSFEENTEERDLSDGVGFYWRWTLACGVIGEQYFFRVLEPLCSERQVADEAIHAMSYEWKDIQEMVTIDAQRLEANEDLVIFIVTSVTHANSATPGVLDIV